MPAWVITGIFYLVTSVLSYVVSRRLAGRRNMPEAPQAGQMEAPTAKVSGNVPVVFGTVWLTPNVVWYGDLRTEGIQRCDSGAKK